MNSDQIVVGEHYGAKVSGKRVVVRVERILTNKEAEEADDGTIIKIYLKTWYQVLNLLTNRRMCFYNPSRFLCLIKSSPVKR